MFSTAPLNVDILTNLLPEALQYNKENPSLNWPTPKHYSTLQTWDSCLYCMIMLFLDYVCLICFHPHLCPCCLFI